jgi:rhodanese-related sulfurtransferase
VAEGFDADYSLTAPDDRAHFFPNSASVVLQLVFDKRTRRVLGLQAFGMMNDSISARIDVAAVMISKGATIEDFMMAEMAYAPPFSAAIDSLNAAAFVADNICAGRMRSVSMDRFYTWMADFSTEPDWVVLDVRHPKEAEPFVEKFGADKWIAIAYDKVNRQHKELPTDKTLIIFCGSGNRAYEVQVFLDHLGLKNSLVLGGGMKVIRWMGADWLP